MATAETKRATEVMTGAEILVKSLVEHGVDVVFAYPGGCSMPIHQALTRYEQKLRTILPRHEQGGGFAAQGLPRSLDSAVHANHFAFQVEQRPTGVAGINRSIRLNKVAS